MRKTFARALCASSALATGLLFAGQAMARSTGTQQVEELVVTGATEDRRGKPRGLTAIFDDVHALFRKGWRRSDPKGYWIGPKCAEAVKRTGLRLREPGHKGRLYGIWR